jgi:eukaryotic-like serine/threonine-protein kinase
MFHGDPAHSGVLQSSGPKQLKGVKWTFKAGNSIVSSPVLADSVAFVGSDDGKLYAIDLATGKEKWNFATKSYIRSSPAVKDGLVFVISYDGFFYAVDQATGKEKWKFAVPGERKFAAPGIHGTFPRAQLTPDFWDIYQSSPTVVGGSVYFGAGDAVFALDAATGAKKWQFTTKDIVHSSPAVVDGVLYIGSYDRNLYALDAATGTLKWNFATVADPENHNLEGIQSSPTVVGGVVYFGCRDRNLYALDAATGKEKWKYTITWMNATPAVSDGVVYIGSSIPTFFIAVDAQSGKELYKIDTQFPTFSSPAIADGMAYIGTFGGKLYAIDLKEKKTAWVYQTEAAQKNAGNHLMADGTPNYPTLFSSNFCDQHDIAGSKLFSLGSIVSSPVIADGVVYVGSADGCLYAIE